MAELSQPRVPDGVCVAVEGKHEQLALALILEHRCESGDGPGSQATDERKVPLLRPC